MYKILTPLAFALGMATVAAQAEPVLSTDEIVQHFIKSAKLGESRAICIGTDQECKAKAEAPAEALGMRVNFELNSATLSAGAQEQLKNFAAAMNDPKLKIGTFEVDGHTDARGTEILNDELSVRRAQAVTKVLVDLGVAPDRIHAKGYGMSKPLTADPMADVNRRVETRMVMPKG